MTQSIAPRMATAAFNSYKQRLKGGVIPVTGRITWVNGLREDDDNGKRGITVLIPPHFQHAIADVQAAVKAAVEANFPANKRGGLALPKITDAGEKSYPGYEAGHLVIKASVKTEHFKKVKIVDPRGQPVDVNDYDALYSGRWAEVHVRPFGYDKSGNRGVSLALVGIQLLDHDEPLGGSQASFGSFEDMATSGAGSDAGMSMASYD